MKQANATENNLAKSLGPSLVRYDAMCRAIEACHRVDEVKEIHDKARAMEVYARQAKNREAELKAQEIRLRAERRAGQLLAEMKRKGERANAKHNLKRGPKLPKATSGPTLKDLGITKTQSHDWQKLAEVPAIDFEKALRDPSASRRSTRQILAGANKERVKPINPDAVWMWKKLREMETARLTVEGNPRELFDALTDTMQREVIRILPAVIAWLNDWLNALTDRLPAVMEEAPDETHQN